MARKYQLKATGVDSYADPGNKDNNKLVSAALFKVDSLGKIKTDNTIAKFLLNPSSLEDNKSGNWAENIIPGQSNPIMQWVSGGARTLNFTALVTKDMVHEPKAEDNLLGGIVDSAITAVGSIASAFAGVNIPPLGDTLAALNSPEPGEGDELSIASELDYYRSLMYPEIDEDKKLKTSPPLLVLAMGRTLGNIPKAIKGGISAESDLWVAKNVSIRITKWLPNLMPMEAEVTFELAQYIIESISSTKVY